MPPRSVLPLLPLACLLASAPPIGAAESGTLLHMTEGNRMRRLDVDTLGTDVPAEDVLIQRAGPGGEGGAGGSTPNGRDVNGMVCPFPDGSGRFVAGEDTDQPSPPAGWGIFAPDGTQVGKLTATYPRPDPEPFGCAFLSDGRLLTTSTGAPGLGTRSGQLILWFPPFEGFPGPPGAYPETDAASTNFCKLAVDLGTSTGVAVDAEDRVYVAEGGQLRITRFAPPFPTGLGPGEGCEALDPATGSPMADAVQRSVAVQGDFFTPWSTFTGLAMGPAGTLYAASILGGAIGEFRLDAPTPDLADTLLRPVLLPDDAFPYATGTPQGLAVADDGTVYYADLDLVGEFPDVGPGPDGKVRRIRMDASGDPLPPEILKDGLAFPDGVALLPGHLPSREWRSYAGGPRRRFHNAEERVLGPDEVASLTTRWRFETDAIITASPAVARIDLPGEGPTPLAFIQSWDGFVYAVRMADGSELWRFRTEPQPGANFPNTASAHVEAVAGRETVFIGSGHVFYALDAVTGQERWRFVAGSGCRDASGSPPGECGLGGERNEIESSAWVADGKVFFGMDVNDTTGGKGGFYALDAADGRLAWFFDLESGSTCRPFPEDEIRKFDGYHDAATLDLPADFFATRPGCDFPRSPNGCGNVWSTPSYDPERGVLYVTSSNCDTREGPGDDPRKPDPPMPPFDESVFALTTDGTPLWRWRAYDVDPDDFAFGASPNLFTLDLPGVGEVDVLGVGQKDGHYRVLDRDGVNRLTGVDCTRVGPDGVPGCVDPAMGGAPGEPADFPGFPYWDTQVVPGGAAGGVILTASVDVARRRIAFSTAPGFDPVDPQQPTLHWLDMDTGAVVWDSSRFAPGSREATLARAASFGPTSTIPGVAFFGSVPLEVLRALPVADDDPDTLYSFPLSDLPFTGAASGAVVVDGTVLVGHGIGVRGNPQDEGTITSNIPSALVALCAPGTAGCAACADGVDNDADGAVDGEDPGCRDAGDTTERPDCLDGVDNDHDGLADWPADPGCRNRLPRSQEAPACSDGRDNDGDGAVDFAPASGPADPDCLEPWGEAESSGGGPACGLSGLEGLLAWAWLARRRRRRNGRARALVTAARRLGRIAPGPLALALSVLAPVAAHAGPMPARVDATLSVRLGGAAVFTSETRRGIVSLDPATREVVVPAGLFATTGTLSGLVAVRFDLDHGAGTFRPGGAAAGACPGPLGGAGACILGTGLGGGLGGTLPFLGALSFSTLGVASLPPALGAAVTVSGGAVVLQAAPWTARTAAVTTTGSNAFWTTARGAAPGSFFSRAGSTGASGAQPLQLVSPVHVALAPDTRAPVFVTLSMHLVPEPAPIVLLALGALGALVPRFRRPAPALSCALGRKRGDAA